MQTDPKPASTDPDENSSIAPELRELVSLEQGFAHFLGMRWLEMQEGQASCQLDLEAWHQNLNGRAHGGVLGSMLDSTLGAAVVSSLRSGETCGTVQLSIQFLQAAFEGRLICQARCSSRGSRIAFAEGEVFQGDTLVARAQGTWHIWPPRKHP